MNRAYDKVLTLLEGSGVEYRLHDHIPIRTIEEAHEKVPHLTVNLLKTVVFRIKDRGWALAAVGGAARIHYKKLGDALGVNRRELRSVSPEEIQSHLGFEVGGVGPFPVTEDVRVVIDQGLEDLGIIFCGSGRNTRTIEIDLSKLIGLSGAVLWPVIKKQDRHSEKIGARKK